MARKVSDPSFQFRYASDYYTVDGARSLSQAELRAEYTRMRDAAQKRVKRLQAKFPQAKSGQKYYFTGEKDAEGNPIIAPGFMRLKDISPEKLPEALSELAKFLKAKSSTVTGQKQIKEKTIATWQKQGLNLTPKNYDTAIKILEEMRRRKIVYGSDKVISMAEHMQGLSPEEQSKWLAHLDYLFSHEEQLQEIPAAAGYTFEQVVEMIGG